MAKRLIIFFISTIYIFSLLPLPSLGEPLNVNLVQGLTYNIQSGEKTDSSLGTLGQGSYDIDNGQLTDGNFASLSEDAEGWYRSNGGRSRIVTFDLGEIMAVSYIKAGFLHSRASGIYAPRYINVLLSDDGVNFGYGGKYTTNYRTSSSTVARYDALIKLDEIYSARFVRIEISCDKLMYCDEIEVYGEKKLSGNESKVTPLADISSGSYPQSVAGVSNIVKVENGYNKEFPLLSEYTEEELLPYIVYLGSNGEIGGLMFDGMIFSPCDSVYPSGGSLASGSSAPGGIKSDWELYIQRTFEDMDSLNRAAEKAFLQIGVDKKFKVFFTIPYPRIISKPFGDINNDGFDEYCRTFNERNSIVKWYIDKCLSDFETKGYEALSLGGFSWGNNELDYGDSDHEVLLITEMNDYVHRMNCETVISFDYLASGFDSWKAFGFSDSLMKPNSVYGNDKGFGFDVIAECAENAHKYQMGVEIEIAGLEAFQGDSYQRAGFNYEGYLYNGKAKGYMTSLKVFDQGFGEVYYTFCYGDLSTPKGIYLRRLYELTFKFIHYTYSNLPPILETESEIELVNGDTNITLNLSVNDDDSYFDDIKIEFPRMPAHGNVAAAANKKSLIFSTDQGFEGEDSFTVRVTDGFGYSEEHEIKVAVVAPEIFENSFDKGTSSEESVDIVIPDNSKEGMPVWLAVILIGLAAAMVIVSLVVIFKPKAVK